MSQKEIHKILANQLPTDCHNYCEYITDLFLGEISPTIFNKEVVRRTMYQASYSKNTIKIE